MCFEEFIPLSDDLGEQGQQEQEQPQELTDYASVMANGLNEDETEFMIAAWSTNDPKEMGFDVAYVNAETAKVRYVEGLDIDPRTSPKVQDEIKWLIDDEFISADTLGGIQSLIRTAMFAVSEANDKLSKLSIRKRGLLNLRATFDDTLRNLRRHDEQISERLEEGN